MHFVTNETEHRQVFGEAIEVENIEGDTFPAIATSAFPDLAWADDVWRGLRTNKTSFFGGNRPVLVRHLAVLNDDGAAWFHENPGGQGVAERLASKSVEASSENGRARSYNPSIRDRTRRFRERDYVFWWHTKIQWDKGRIHFLHEPGDPPPHGRIVVGIFAEHCVLPN